MGKAELESSKLSFFEQCRSHTCSYHTCHMVSMLSKQRKKVNINSVLPKKKKPQIWLGESPIYLTIYLLSNHPMRPSLFTEYQRDTVINLWCTHALFL